MRLKALLTTAVIAGLLAVAAAPAAAGGRGTDPWMSKPVLPLLLLTAGEEYAADAAALAAGAGLTAAEVQGLRDIALREAEATAALVRESDSIVRDPAVSEEAKRQGIENMGYNVRLARIMAQTDGDVRDLLGTKYAGFRRGIRDWWAVERARAEARRVEARRGEADTQADIFSREVFCTQYNGYTTEEIALPDKYLKWANLGWDYTYPNPPYTADLYLSRTNKWANGVLVREVGPWNIDDNYWDSNRRMWKDLPLGRPEAEAAYYNGYNGGKDQFGRKVTVPCACDLTPTIAGRLGLGYLENAWVRVYYYDFP